MERISYVDLMVTTQFEQLTGLARPSLVFRRVGRKVNIGGVVRLRTNSFVVDHNVWKLYIDFDATCHLLVNNRQPCFEILFLKREIIGR